MAALHRQLVVIPTYNEAENLPPLVAAILALNADLHILVVDDNSPDGTGAIADRLAQRHPEVHVLHRQAKLGLGPAYIAGFEWALAEGYDYVFEMDCDFSHDPSALPRFLTEIPSADLVIGSRYVKGGSTPDWSLKRKAISRLGNLISRTLLRLRTHDTTGGYRCYRRELLETIPWYDICARGYGFQVAAVFYAERLGARIHEFPITFRDRRVGQSKMSAGIVKEALTCVMELAFYDFRKRPPTQDPSELTL
jgi:dolichol-phosphate mannosyltransferase